MKTRVAIVLPYFSQGGAQVMITRLATHLDLSTVEAEVICVYGKPQNNWMEKEILNHGIPIKYIGKSKGFSGGAVLRLGKELSGFKPDVIHTHLSACVYCAAWALIHRVKMLHTVHNIPDKELIKSKQLVMRYLYKRGAAIPVAISNEIHSLIKKHYGLDTSIETVYNPVDVDRFSSVKKKAHANTVAITAGRLSDQKNHKLLINAFIKYHKKHVDDELIILGDGPCRADLEMLIHEHGAESYIHLEGNVENIAEYFAKADVFALSSDYEGLPLVVLEAMAASLPIISTDVGGIKDLIDGNGILVEAGDEEQLCKALTELKEDVSKRSAMGEKSFSLVQKYDSSIIVGEYVELYKKYS